MTVFMLTQLEMNMFFSSKESKLWYIHRLNYYKTK